jgi:hypothetical protein
MWRWTLGVGALVVAVTVSSCTDSNQPDEPPGLDRIDGPARVDPSFDPFATVPVTGGG